MELYKNQVDLLRRFVPEFSVQYGRKQLSGADDFWFRDGRLRMFASHAKASLELSIVVRVLKVLCSHKDSSNHADS